MKDKIAKAWASLSAGQGVALAGLCLMVGYVAVHLPPEVWERIAEKDPSALGAGVGGFVLALYGVFARPNGGAE
jgi:hypothetical protein